MLIPGLDLTRQVIFDQHFTSGRTSRAIQAAWHAPLSIGIEENTAVVLNDHSFRVIGEGGITIFSRGKDDVTTRYVKSGVVFRGHN